MPITVPSFETTVSITESTLISNADDQLNILMNYVETYAESTYQTVAIYSNGLTIEVINWHKEVGYTIVDVKRPLTKNEDCEYTDDITAEEIEAGYDAVRGFLYREIADPLFFKVQRGEIEESVWLDEIQKIKDENKMEVTNG